MNRRWIPFAVAALFVAAGAAWWWEVGRPQQQAFEVADILAGRDLHRVALGNGALARLLRLWAVVRGRSPMDEAFDRTRWANDELPALAQAHPRAVARAALLESDSTTRHLLLWAIRDSDVYETLPTAMRLDEVLSDGVFDLDNGLRISDPQRRTLVENRAVVLPELHAALRDGHCGAIRALALLDDRPAPGDIAAGLAAPKRSDRCREWLVTELPRSMP